MAKQWDLVSGRDLQDSHVRQSPLSEYLPDTAAIYFWRRALRVPRSALSSHKAFAQWLDIAMQAPIAKIRDHRASHFAVVDLLTIRSSGLTTTKQQHFPSLMATRGDRQRFAQYLHDFVGQFVPPLYCGETENLAQRTQDHLSGETAFGQQLLNQELSVSWSDLDLVFYPLDRIQPQPSTRARDYRKLLELVSTAFSLAGYVSRRG